MINLSPQHLAVLMELIRQYAPDAGIWAYGSRVSGGAHEGSDVDLVLRNPADLTRRQIYLMELKEAIAKSKLPILVDVMDWAHIPDVFQQQIEKSMWCWPNQKTAILAARSAAEADKTPLALSFKP